jgi:L-histidine N-alpha-methyltransferase
VAREQRRARAARLGRTRYYGSVVPAGSLREDVIAGLSLPQKSLPPKYFYDAEGSRLFERICRLPEYYPTRAELAITRVNLAAIARFGGAGCELIEYGSGASLKTRLLIRALRPAAYVPVDISASPGAGVSVAAYLRGDRRFHSTPAAARLPGAPRAPPHRVLPWLDDR